MWPEWFRVVLYYAEEVSYAPTVPFVLGALRNPVGAPVDDEEQCLDDLRTLMHSVVEDTPEDYVIQLHRCGQIGQPVLVPNRERSGLYRLPGNPLSSTTQDRATVFADDEFVAPGSTDLESVVELLWDELGEAILENRLSYHKGSGAYCEYNDRDRKIIRSAIGRK